MRASSLAGLVLAPLAVAGMAVSSASAVAVAVPEPVSTTRPQLTAEQAAQLTPADYFGDWKPRPVKPGPAARADYIVDPAGNYPTVQSAIDAAVAAGGTARRLIAVRPGVHREVVCVPAAAPPITLFGTARSAAGTVIVHNNANPTPKATGTPANPCNPNLAAITYGTGGSATFAALAADFQAKNLTFANDYVEDTYPSGNQAAVALAAAGDR